MGGRTARRYFSPLSQLSTKSNRFTDFLQPPPGFYSRAPPPFSFFFSLSSFFIFLLLLLALSSFFFLFNDRRISNVRTNVQGKRKVKSCHSSVGCARKVWQIVFHWFTASSSPSSSTIPPVHPQFPREIRKPCSPGWNIIEVDPRNLFRCFIRCCVASTREDSLSIAEQFK